MRTIGKLLTWGGACAFVFLLDGSAHGALTSAQQKCLDGYNNKLRLVGQQAGKDYRTCVKNSGKGTEPNPDLCVTNDTPGKIAGKEAKVVDLYLSGKCIGGEPIQQGQAVGITAMVNWSQELVRGIFGDPIAGTVTPGKPIAKCQDKAYQRAEQLFTAKLLAFRACKKGGMKSGAIVDSFTLQTQCMQPTIPDPNAKIAGKVQKLFDDVNANCGPPVGPPYTGIFPGDCSGSVDPNSLGACIERVVECKVCKALNDADGMGRNCDLFDDGIANASCGIVLHKCVLNTSNCSPFNSACSSLLQLHIAALPVPLLFGLSGALDIGGGLNKAACGIQTLNPVNIPSIGLLCIVPGTGCANGLRWCGPGPGPALGVDVLSDGLAGACTSNAQCAAMAAAGATSCPTQFGTGYVPLSTGCTGYCSGTTPQACTADAQCLPSNGACNGSDPVVPAQANLCQISCIDTQAHGPSVPGAIQCNLGANLTVEAGGPCDGTDVLFNVGTVCIPMSTEEASSLITDANFLPGSVVPVLPNVNDLLGVSIPCATLDTSVTTGLRSTGAVNFYGSALGDLAVGIKATCN